MRARRSMGRAGPPRRAPRQRWQARRRRARRSRGRAAGCSCVRGSCEHRASELLEEPKVVPVVPDLDDLAAIIEPKDVHARERNRPLRWRDLAPSTGVRAGGGPPAGNEVAVAKDEIYIPAEVGERVAKLLGDRRLARGAWSRLGRPQIVPNVVVREDLVRKGHIPFGPDLFVEPPNECFVVVGAHPTASYRA